MYYDVKDLWPLLVRRRLSPEPHHLLPHKLGLNTFAVCRTEPDPETSE